MQGLCSAVGELPAIPTHTDVDNGYDVENGMEGMEGNSNDTAEVAT